MRRLNRQVLAGGVVHPAGTAATEELEDLVPNDEFWTDDEITVSEEDQDATGGDDTSNVISERETALQAEVERLTSEVERLEAENTELREQAGTSSDGDADGQTKADPDPAEDYSGYDVKSLKAEINLRNQGRETPIDIAEPGNKPELIAALTADDQARD